MNTARKIESEEKYVYADYIKWEDSENWELIGGKAYAMAPSPFREHQEISLKIVRKIADYLEGKPCKVYYEWDVILSDEDIFKPDIIVVCDKNKITRRGVKGAPDFVIEILSPSTAKRDKTLKLEKYKEYGVKEYWIVDVYNKLITVNHFEKNEKKEYFAEEITEEEEEEKENVIPVEIFGGELKLDLKYLFQED